MLLVAYHKEKPVMLGDHGLEPLVTNVVFEVLDLFIEQQLMAELL
jgi:hypothetical protein